MKKAYFGIGFFIAFFGFGYARVSATEFTSANYQVLDPVLNPAGFSTSTNYQLIGAIAQIALGTSTASSFQLRGGFLFFPYATSPTVSATAGDGQVSLSWASDAYWATIDHYDIGQATASGGPYAFSSVGNVTLSTRTGLTNGTTYYFIVRVLDSSNVVMATSSEASKAPVASQTTPTPTTHNTGSGGGGGSGFAPTVPVQGVSVVIEGRSYPNADITILKDGSVLSTLTAGEDGNFKASADLPDGIYTFSLYAIDSENRRSLTTSFTTTIFDGKVTTISGIVIAPTITTDKSQVKFGNDIKFFGSSYPNSQINVIINSNQTIVDSTSADKFGLWSYTLDSSALEHGDHTTRGQTRTADQLLSSFSESLAFRVGDSDIPFERILYPFGAPAAKACNKNGDINGDKRINIVDFSILLYFWNQRNPSNACADINNDKIVNLSDFSIMLYWWTG